MISRVTTATLLLFFFLSISVKGDVIELKTGQKIEAEVLKEKGDALYVDLGTEVIRIPRNRIRSWKKKNQKTTDAVKTSEKDFYTTAHLKQGSVKELAERFGQGVVLVQTPGGLGSGFIVNKRGYCVTNYHVIEKETRIAVTIFHKTKSGEFKKVRIGNVKIVALNPFVDLALLQIPKQKEFEFKPVVLAKKHDYKEGDEVFAIGNPLGLERSVSKGIVSTRARNFGGLVYIQTTTQINPGNSGGPLFNGRGEIVGVTNMKLTFGEGLGFAIPIDYLKQFLNTRDAFAFDKDNPNTGVRYLEAPRRKKKSH